MSTRPSRKRKIINYNNIESDNSLSLSSSSNDSIESSKGKSKRKTKKTKTLKKKEPSKKSEFSPKKQAFINKIKEILSDITLDEETENEIIKCVTGIYQEKEKDYLIEFIERKLKKFPMYKNDNDIIEKIINSNNDKNKIIILSGLPGVGKSTFSNNLQNYQEFDLLSLDSITTGIYFPKINKMEEYLFDKIKKEDKNYIFDGTFLDYNEIVKYYRKVHLFFPTHRETQGMLAQEIGLCGGMTILQPWMYPKESHHQFRHLLYDFKNPINLSQLKEILNDQNFIINNRKQVKKYCSFEIFKRTFLNELDNLIL